MSGSPIIQDGKIVGAVTHVLVDDPTRGYGIFIEEMLLFLYKRFYECRSGLECGDVNLLMTEQKYVTFKRSV